MVAEAAVMNLETYLSTLESIITAVISWAVKVLETITSNPILLVPFGVVAVFTAIKVLKQIF